MNVKRGERFEKKKMGNEALDLSVHFVAQSAPGVQGAATKLQDTKAFLAPAKNRQARRPEKMGAPRGVSYDFRDV
ncbi:MULTISPECIES: hypothetical protein [Paenibacillus]|uniref:hypothetical protein n=1 Tax=Paenibacillus TaxID=44249 RepID=UPI001FD19C3B|nr:MULTISPECIES: hypothetical protein [Paenibacillus]